MSYIKNVSFKFHIYIDERSVIERYTYYFNNCVAKSKSRSKDYSSDSYEIVFVTKQSLELIKKDQKKANSDADLVVQLNIDTDCEKLDKVDMVINLNGKNETEAVQEIERLMRVPKRKKPFTQKILISLMIIASLLLVGPIIWKQNNQANEEFVYPFLKASEAVTYVSTQYKDENGDLKEIKGVATCIDPEGKYYITSPKFVIPDQKITITALNGESTQVSEMLKLSLDGCALIKAMDKLEGVSYVEYNTREAILGEPSYMYSIYKTSMDELCPYLTDGIISKKGDLDDENGKSISTNSEFIGMEGSPIFSENGELIGLTAKKTNPSSTYCQFYQMPRYIDAINRFVEEHK